MMTDLFFPFLARRANYPLKHDQSFYQYERYRGEICEDCKHRCVYCDIHQNECGGSESMHLDHFRPKVHFSDLINDPNNLVWACPGCNRFKGEHWPALGVKESFLGDEGFIEPFLVNRLDYFKVAADGELLAQKPPANYQINLLQLNRQTRKLIRYLRLLKLRIAERLIENAKTLEEMANRKDQTEKDYLELLRIANELKDEAKLLMDTLLVL
jgi:hypothetical protein